MSLQLKMGIWLFEPFRIWTVTIRRQTRDFFLHCQYAARHQPSTSPNASSKSVIFKNPDTHVCITGISKARHIGTELIFNTGRGNNRRILSLSAINTNLGEDVSDALISFHCFTGSGTVSSFHGKSKAKALKVFAGDEVSRLLSNS